MNKPLMVRLPLILAAIVALSPALASNLSRDDYNAEKTRIVTDHKAADVRCETLAGNGKDVCMQESKASEKIARADLEYRLTGRKNDRRKAMTARAEGDYAVAKEKCEAMAGNEKDVCVQEAKAARTKTLADVKLGKDVSEARANAAADSRDADYKVAVERCDSYSGDTKTDCLNAAKVKFNKS